MSSSFGTTELPSQFCDSVSSILEIEPGEYDEPIERLYKRIKADCDEKLNEYFVSIHESRASTTRGFVELPKGVANVRF